MISTLNTQKLCKFIKLLKDSDPESDISNYDFTKYAPGDLRNTISNITKTQLKPSDIFYDIQSNEVINTLKALQRLTRLMNKSIELSENQTADSIIEEPVVNLYNKGLHSAYQIASMAEKEFVAKYIEDFSTSDERQVRNFYQNAVEVKQRAIFDYVAITQHQGLHYSASRFNNLKAGTDDRFKAFLPNYDQLFGSSDFCNCSDCRSMLSPAAYLFDLMRIVSSSNYITYSDDAHHVSARRPDIFNNLQLSCVNTDSLISRLKIVNNVLVQALVSSKTISSANDLSGYLLNQTVYPLNLPSNIPLMQARTYLNESNTSLPAISKALNINSDFSPSIAFYLESLGIISQSWQNIYTNITAPTNELIEQWYGVDDITELKKTDVFLQQTGLTYDELSELLFQDLSDAEIAQGLYTKFFINPKTLISGIATRDVDTLINNFSNDNFARANRFIRLARDLGWSFTELDWVLNTISNFSDQKEIADNALPYLTAIKTMRDKGLDVNMICAFFGNIRTFGKANKDGTSFFDQVFSRNISNAPDWYDLQGIVWSVPTTSPDTVRTSTADPSLQLQIQSALAAALKLRDVDLITIANIILIAQRATSQDLTLGIANIENIALLYRLSFISRIIGMPLNDCRIAYTFQPVNIDNRPEDISSQNYLLYDLAVATAEQVVQIVNILADNTDWLQVNNLSIGLVQYWLTGQSNTPAIQNQIISIEASTNFISQLNSALNNTLLTPDIFSANIQTLLNSHFATLEPVTIYKVIQTIGNIKALAGAITDSGVVIFIPTPKEIEEALLTISQDASNTQALVSLISDTMAHYQKMQQTTYYNHLADLYNVDYESVTLLSIWSNLTIDMVTKSNPIVDIAIGPNSVISESGRLKALNYSDPVITALREMQVYSSWVTTLQLSFSELQAFDSNTKHISPDIIIDSLADVDFFSLRLLHKFKSLTSKYNDSQNNILRYLTRLESVDNPNYFLASIGTAPYSFLASIFDWDADQLLWLVQHLESVEPNIGTLLSTIKGLALIDNYHDIMKAININVTGLYTLYELLQKNSTITDVQSTLQAAASQLLAGLQSKYQDDPDQLQAVNNKVYNQTRNVLLPLTIYSMSSALQGTNYNVSNARSLSEYLLTDVEVDAIVETSPIAEATAALQLFIYRCRSHLEPSAIVTATLDQWWSWLEHYRIWQANREVFLYPENYIEPSLRRDKTTLFTRLENSLKQADLSNNNIAASSIGTYLDSLATLAGMELISASTYIDSQNNNQVIVIGRTGRQPTQYYYLTGVFSSTWSLINWGEWSIINADIQTIGPLSATFHNGRLYIAWVVKTQINSAQQGQGSASSPLYSASINYSYLDSNDQWVSTHQLAASVISQNSLNSPDFNSLISCSFYRSIDSTGLYSLYLCYNTKGDGYLVPNSGSSTLIATLSTPNNTYINVNKNTNVTYIDKANDSSLPIICPLARAYSIFLNFTLTDVSQDVVLFTQTTGQDVPTPGNFNITFVSSSGLIAVNGTDTNFRININTSYNLQLDVITSNDDRRRQQFVVRMNNGQIASMRGAQFITNQANIVIIGQGQGHTDKIQKFKFPGTMANVQYRPTTDPNNSNFLSNNESGSSLVVFPANQTQSTTVHICPDINIINGLVSAYADEGIDALLSIKSQRVAMIDSTRNVLLNNGSITNYYWELFFHIPFLVARQFQVQQQFEAARRWFEYIFNPTINPVNFDLEPNEYDSDRYWRFIMLRSMWNPILSIELSEPWNNEFRADSQDTAQIYDYHNNSFDPHALAMLRPVAYQKAVLMRCIDNILDFADSLYSQYTAESVNEATMLYIEAYDLLGTRPTGIGTCQLPQDDTFQNISNIFAGREQPVPEFIIGLENRINGRLGIRTRISPINDLPGAYFCLPENTQLIDYWRKVNSRLYNIRHALTIDGIFEQVPLFAPAVDPQQLIAAVSPGTSLTQILPDLQPTIPYYRFRVVIENAKEITQLVISFGQSLLAALEKRDAEQLSRIYSTNQRNLLALTKMSKTNELYEVNETLKSLEASLNSAQIRLNYYSNLIENGLNSNELSQLELDGEAIVTQSMAQELKAEVAAAYLLPNIFGLADGGMNFGDAVAQVSNIAEGTAQALSMSSGLSGNRASYDRRLQEWSLQQAIAQAEVTQINRQIMSAQYQQATARNEITVLTENIKQEQKIEYFLINKFSSQDLYQWISGRLASMYFQAYQLAYKIARKAEKSWEFEKATVMTQSMIQSGGWDNLYRGLLAGETLMMDIQHIEQSYMEQDRRKLEISKTISLAESRAADVTDPNKGALNNLLDDGTCSFKLTKEMFDSDYPNSCCLQIKTIAISFPALLGPYQNICAILQQTYNSVSENKGSDRDSKNNRAVNQQIALSQGVNDSGMIVVNFDDPRYLPFEGTGAVSEWSLTITNFDKVKSQVQQTLTDVVIQLHYTALPNG